jgi:cyclophilin family peptidyl-prolyl cis-trans isomerase
MSRLVFVYLLCALGTMVLAGCDTPNHPGTASTQPSPGSAFSTCPPAPAHDPVASPRRSFTSAPFMNIVLKKGYCAYLSTEAGMVAIRLRPASAPKTVNNFIFLVRQGYYDGLEVSATCPDPATPGCKGQFAELGDPPSLGLNGFGYKLQRESAPGDYLFGAVAMSPDDDGTANPHRFIISKGDSRALPHTYALFGQVTDGLPTIVALQKGVKINWAAVLEAPGTSS